MNHKNTPCIHTSCWSEASLFIRFIYSYFIQSKSLHFAIVSKECLKTQTLIIDRFYVNVKYFYL